MNPLLKKVILLLSSSILLFFLIVVSVLWAFSNNSKVRSSIIHNTVFNLKRFWCPKNNSIDWSNSSEEFLNEFLYEGSQVKNIWIPYGE